MNLSKGYLLTLVAVFLTLSILLVEPFLQYVLGAILLAYALYPLQVRLEKYTSSMIAALSLVILTVIGFVTPFMLIIASIMGNTTRILQNLEIESNPIEEIESLIEGYTGQEIDIVGEIAGSTQEIRTVVFEQSTDAFNSVTHFVIGITLGLFIMYYLLKEGDKLIDWLYQTVPLPIDIQRNLYDDISDMMWAVLFGHVFVAIVQGGVAGLGFFATGIPNATFWTIIMMVLAMVPLVGAIPIWGGAVVYLFLLNKPLLAIALFAYSVIVVGLTDDYLRPFAVERYAELNPAVILLGILGGAYTFGIMGLFFGPIILGGLKATLHVVSNSWDRLGEGW
ncbi:AI-2E family transporter [Natronorubrum aibiense]|uniref:AI-2E family transporter n=1 Tax=Natronorubrum aibiense TaxID=348826 RepID=A0A5P9P8C4_9EURY|nr:AI-2E family transporter [Natronorubrum aibiense]QFU84385.1 AI-2E family transporter [Natronorubrum aibiense]